jgi:hypothetical protein
MGNPQKLGNFVNALFQDASNNVGIGAAPSGSYKLEVTGTAKVSSTLLVSGAATFSSTVSATKVILSLGAEQAELTSAFNNDFKLTNSGTFRIINNANTVALLTVTNAGNVGIGTSSPASILGIDNSANANTTAITITGYSSTPKAHIGQFSNNLYLSSNWYYGGGQQRDSASFGSTAIVLGSGTADADNYIDFSTATSAVSSPTNRMRISSGGLVTIPYQPSFYATSTAGETAYANNEVIVFNTARHNTGSYNTSNGRFTAPIAGKYLFALNIYAYGGYTSQIVLTINGAQYVVADVTPYAVQSAGNAAINIGFSLVWELAAGDYIEPRSRGNSQIYRAHSHFSGQLLS